MANNINLPEGGGGAVWGSITGTLSSQTDLQNALNAKLNITDIIDNLVSTDVNKALSANQGKELNDNYNELLGNVYAFKHKVKTKIDNLYTKNADVVLTTIGVTDLQIAINSLTEGQILEVQTNASYDPIVIPTTKKIIIRAGIGWLPKIAGARCIRLSNGCDDVVISGFIIENATNVGGNNNYTGTCITFDVHQTIVNDIIFHNITMKTTTTGSAVVLSYHWSVSGDLYYNPPQLAELSNNVAFVKCNIWKGCLDGTEGACILLRGVKNAYIANNRIDNGDDVGRGIMLNGFLNCLIENNNICCIGGVNAEAIKCDEIGTSPFRQTVVVDANKTFRNIEGIDIDDNVSAIVSNNVCRLSSNEGISLDDSSSAIMVDNVVFDCRDGILFEVGSVGYLANNNVFNNYNVNYKMDNGYIIDGSNISDPSHYQKSDFYAYTKILTEASPVNIMDVFVNNNNGSAIKLKYMIVAINSGTNVVEVHYGEYMAICRNQNGVIDSQAVHPASMEVDLPLGVGITDTFSIVNGIGKITIALTATSGIAPTSLKMYFDVDYFGDKGYMLL